MAKTYTPTLIKARDWVRLQIGDHRAGKMVLEDEEIDAVVAAQKQSNRNLAAAACGELIIARAGNVLERRVDDLQIKYGQGDAQTAYSKHLDQLRAAGAQELLSRQSNFRLL